MSPQNTELSDAEIRMIEQHEKRFYSQRYLCQQKMFKVVNKIASDTLERLNDLRASLGAKNVTMYELVTNLI